MTRLWVLVLLLMFSNSFAQTADKQHCRIEFYLLRTSIPDTPGKPGSQLAVKRTDLEVTAFINDLEILGMKVKDPGSSDTRQIFEVSAAVTDRIRNLDIPLCCGRQFALVVNDSIVYSGYFWNTFSSFGCNGITAFADGTTIEILRKLPDHGFFIDSVDRRQHSLLFDCLTKTNRLHKDQPQSTGYLKVHFLYGSKPLKKYKDTEKKWFGGVLGGHVGIESDSDKIVNFLPSGEFHWFAKKDDRHSRYAVHSFDNFYAILGGKPDSNKKAIVYIPVTAQQKAKFDSIATVYLAHTPYDYAFFGMRCGAAAYDILGQLGILTNYSQSKTFKKIFYPKKLRRILLRKASENHWIIVKHDGSAKRKWERD